MIDCIKAVNPLVTLRWICYNLYKNLLANIRFVTYNRNKFRTHVQCSCRMEKRLSLMSFFPNQVTTTTIIFLCACFDPKFDNYILLYNFCNRTKINQKKNHFQSLTQPNTTNQKKKTQNKFFSFEYETFSGCSGIYISFRSYNKYLAGVKTRWFIKRLHYVFIFMCFSIGVVHVVDSTR